MRTSAMGKLRRRIAKRCRKAGSLVFFHEPVSMNARLVWRANSKILKTTYQSINLSK